MEIEVEWESIASGISQIEIEDLGCQNEKDWDKLSEGEQGKRLNQWLLDNEYQAYKNLAWQKI